MYVRFSLTILLMLSAWQLALGQSGDSPSLLVRPSDQAAQNVELRNELRIGKARYWAKEDRIGLFRIDISALESTGKALAFQPFGGEPVSIISHGVRREHDTAYLIGTWTGEIQDPSGGPSYPVELGVTTFVVDKEGNFVLPAPSWTSVDSQTGEQITVRSADGRDQSGMPVVYSITGRIDVPFKKSRYVLSSLPADRDYVVLYEADERKALTPVDNFGEIENSAESIESTRIAEEFRRYVENLEKEIADRNNQRGE